MGVMTSTPPEANPFDAPRITGLTGWLAEKPDDRARDLSRIVSMLPDVVFKCEKRADGKIYWLLNEGQLAEQFGITTEKIRDKSLDQLFPPDVAARLLPHFERCFAGEAHEFINEMHGRHFKHYPQPVFDAHGRVESVVGFITDVTSMKTAEDEILRLNSELAARVEELEVANRQLEAFSYSVSHDLRGPLSVMTASMELLHKFCDHGNDQAVRVLARLQRTISRMDLLISDIMSMAKATRGELLHERVDLSSIAHDITSELKIRFPNRNVVTHIEPDLNVIGDPRLLHVVLENLLSNAWKYTGRVEQARIALESVPGKAVPTFVVRDNGAGFDMSQAGKLFAAFERLHSDAEFAGTGVGLATVRRIIAAHGGDIWAEGAPEQGAAFYFSILGRR